MSDLIERPTDAADPTYPDAERCAQTLENCEDDLLTEAQFVRWQGQEIERLRQWETCGREWLDKTDWVQQRMNSGDLPSTALGKHRADVMREEIERLTAEREGLCADSWQLRKMISRVEAERDELRRQLDEAGESIARQAATIRGLTRPAERD